PGRLPQSQVSPGRDEPLHAPPGADARRATGKRGRAVSRSLDEAGGRRGARHLVLGSTSPYRRQLLERFALPFTVAAPHVDESPLPGELAIDLVQRLARMKADAVARRHTDSLVIGSDQLALCG